MNNKTSELFISVIRQLMGKLSVVDRNEKLCYGLTVSQYRVIEKLHSKPGTMGELSREFGLAVSTMTRNMDILFRDGIVKRNQDPEDRRKVYVELTEKGKDLAEKLIKCSETYLLGILDNVPEGKRKDVVEGLEVLSKSITVSFEKCCKRT